MTEVRNLAEQVKSRFPALNGLILNAGTYQVNRYLTTEGFERTWAVNYLSRFLLTDLLLDLLKQNGPARIVDVSGAYHSKGNIHVDDVLSPKLLRRQANNQSKLANVLFTYQLAKNLADAPVTVNTLHPGAVKTDLIFKTEGVSPFAKMMYGLFSSFFKSPEQGAATAVYLASAPELEGITGKYFVNGKAVKSSRESYRQELQEQLWEMSSRMLSK